MASLALLLLLLLQAYMQAVFYCFGAATGLLQGYLHCLAQTLLLLPCVGNLLRLLAWRRQELAPLAAGRHVAARSAAAPAKLSAALPAARQQQGSSSGLISSFPLDGLTPPSSGAHSSQERQHSGSSSSSSAAAGASSLDAPLHGDLDMLPQLQLPSSATAAAATGAPQQGPASKQPQQGGSKAAWLCAGAADVTPLTDRAVAELMLRTGRGRPQLDPALLDATGGSSMAYPGAAASSSSGGGAGEYAPNLAALLLSAPPLARISAPCSDILVGLSSGASISGGGPSIGVDNSGSGVVPPLLLPSARVVLPANPYGGFNPHGGASYSAPVTPRSAAAGGGSVVSDSAAFGAGRKGKAARGLFAQLRQKARSVKGRQQVR